MADRARHPSFGRSTLGLDIETADPASANRPHVAQI